MDHLQRSLLNYFTMQPLDRVAHLRCDDQWLQTKLDDKSTLFYLLDDDKIITHRGQPIAVRKQQLDSLGLNTRRANFLGTENQHTCFAVNVNDPDSLKSEFDPVESQSLRELADWIDMRTASILAYGQLLNHWHLTNLFCRRCGQTYVREQGGHLLKCSAKACSHIEFPRINPAVIMRVTCEDKILLGRQANWPEKPILSIGRICRSRRNT